MASFFGDDPIESTDFSKNFFDLVPEPWQSMIDKEKLSTIQQRVDQDYKNFIVYPPRHQIFSVLELCGSPNDVRVVILGQDPYINPGEAHGVAFSVCNSNQLPPSLRNIFKEMETDLGIKNTKGDLSKWCNQGVLLLNSTLTVLAHRSNSHADYGWMEITDRIIQSLSLINRNLVFMLWGAYAQGKERLIDKVTSSHLVLKCPHPSPLSAARGFFGCRHFSKCNQYLVANGKLPIDWTL